MVRALWTAASGMSAQQNNVDTISNNLANVNTTGYKTEVAEFKTLLYQNVQSNTTSANGEAKPISAQIGLGVRNSSVTSIFTQGSFVASSSNTAFALDGAGFFGVQGADGSDYYTKNGSFLLAKGLDGLTLSTSDGYPVLNTEGNPISFGEDINASQLTVTSGGEFAYPDESNNPQSMGISIGVFQFTNPSGLEKTDSSLYKETAASGTVINEDTSTAVTKSAIKQGYLEGSNVQVVDEMVNLIVAQRAYEMNSKAIQAADEMMGQANSLRR
jgi:flagellar basal-body rod protein FlgG